MNINSLLEALNNFQIPRTETEDIDLENAVSQIYNLQITNFFPTICNCLLSGEYVSEENFLKSLYIIKQKFDDIQTEFLISINDETDESIPPLFSSALNVINRVEVLITDINKRHEGKAHKKLFISEDLKYKFNSILPEHILKYAQEINEILVSVEYYDHFLTVDNQLLKRLAFLFEKIDQTNFNAEVKILSKSKIRILIKKILLRLKEDKTYGYRYVHNYEDKQLDDFLKPLDLFKNVDERINNHYDDDLEIKNKLTLRERAIPLLSKTELTFCDFQLIVKFYKDDVKSREKLLIYLNKFHDINKELNEEISFNKYAFNVSYQYLYNNLLSIDKGESNEENLQDSLRKVQVLETETGLKNYFPYLYYCRYLIDQLNKTIDTEKLNIGNEKSSQNILFQNNLKNLKRYKEKAFEALEWCNDRDFMSFKVPFEECVFSDEIGGKQVNLFLASSYILPNNYKQINIELESITNSYNMYEIISESYKILSEKINKATESFDEIRNIAKDAQKNNIEILSIFAAIVLFVATNTQVYQFITSTHLALVFMLAMTFSLSLFVLLIWLITRDYNKEISKVPSIHKWIIGILSTATILIILYIIFNPFPDQKNMKDFEKIESRTKNLEQANSSKDSLLNVLNNKFIKIDSINQSKKDIKK